MRTRSLRRISTMVIGAGVTAIATMSLVAQPAPACQPLVTGGPVFITDVCEDAELAQPYVDVDEPRTTTDPATKAVISYRYVHGGFTGSNTRFAFYFPAAAEYQGRFFESTYPTVAAEDSGLASVPFAFANGAYVVATNNNGGVPAGGALAGYRANAAAAKYSRVFAVKVYGGAARPRGYLSGVSGGAYQTIGAAENTKGVWDGFVPIVAATPNANPSNQVLPILALRVLHGKMPQIADALEPGGSGDPYSGLDAEQRAVLQEVTRFGFPLRGWWEHESLIGASSFFSVQMAVRITDPGYVSDFWSLPGYAGSHPSIEAARIQQDANIVSVSPANPLGIVLADVAPGHLLYGADLTVTTGAAKGTTFSVRQVVGTKVTFANASAAAVGRLQPGDTVRIDNSWSLALQYYPRYQVPTSDMYGWNQYRNAHGDPVYPQRSLVGPLLTVSAAGAVSTGRFFGKMIMLGSLLDTEAYPWPSDWYRKQAAAAFGADLDNRYRLWYQDNAGHVGVRTTYAATHLVAYTGVLQQALLDLDAWVVGQAVPPASTRYSVDATNQIRPQASAAARLGVQPVVTLSVKAPKARKPDSVAVRTGQPVTFLAEAAVPPGAGHLVRVEWDFEGDGTFVADTSAFRSAAPTPRAKVEATHSFGQRGTYLVVVRVASQRGQGPEGTWGVVENLARARVIVE
jgi:hypothetical protein